jgi:hypothetical protein
MPFNKEKWLKSVKHTVHEDGSISVDGDVDLCGKGLSEIPFNFRHVSGDFDCSDNQLTSLKYCPTTVGRDFVCSHNQLTSLKYCPSTIKGYFACHYNQLTSLKYCPTTVGGDFKCSGNTKEFSDEEIKNAPQKERDRLAAIRVIVKKLSSNKISLEI